MRMPEASLRDESPQAAFHRRSRRDRRVPRHRRLHARRLPRSARRERGSALSVSLESRLHPAREPRQRGARRASDGRRAGLAHDGLAHRLAPGPVGAGRSMLRFLLRGARGDVGTRPDARRSRRVGSGYRVARARYGGSMMILRLAIAASLVVPLLSGCGGGPSAEDVAQAAALEARIAALEQRKERIEDVNAVERLQAAYGYYADRGLWE